MLFLGGARFESAYDFGQLIVLSCQYVCFMNFSRSFMIVEHPNEGGAERAFQRYLAS